MMPPLCSQLYKMLHFFILMVNISKCSSDNADIVAQNHLKIVQAGDSVNFACIFPKVPITSAVWVKQRVGEKPLSIASSYQGLPGTFENDFDQHKRFFIVKDDRSFNLSITNTEESDTATYYCVKHFFKFTFGDGTHLIVKGKIHDFMKTERSSDVNSTAHKCIYNLPKRNLSLSDAGIYYCAVAACGEILLGDARKPDMPGFQEPWSIIALILGTLNCLSVIVIIFLGTQLYMQRRKDGTQNIQIGHLMDEDRDALNYAALSFQQKSSAPRRPREKHTR